jgi:hypothetical protein
MSTNDRRITQMTFASAYPMYVALGYVYQRFGYDSAALSHSVSDWMGLVVIPNVFL